MEIVVSYPNVADLGRTLLNNYPFKRQEQWSGDHILIPNSLGVGSIHMFQSQGLQFMRGNWSFSEETIFRSPDPVRESGLIDFRLSKNGEVRSAYLEKCDRYEWDITVLNGMRIMVPVGLLSHKQNDILNKFQSYTFDNDITQLMKDLFKLKVDDYLDCLKMEWKFLELTYNWINFLNRKDYSSSLFDVPATHAKAISEAKEILEECLNNPPDIKQLGKMVGLNQQYLKSGFKRLNGITIYQYIINERMKLAKSLIQNDDRPITEVSKFVGYENAGHFAKIYKKYYGVSPLKHRFLS